MRTELSRGVRWSLGFAAVSTDPVLDTLSLMGLLIWGVSLSDRGQSFGLPLLIGFSLVAAIGFIYVSLEDTDVYSWYLAWRARKSRNDTWKVYWFSRFRRSVRRLTKRRVSGGLTVPLYAQRLSHASGSRALRSSPALPVLVRTLVEKEREFQHFMSSEARVREIRSQVDALERELQSSDIFLDGYLRYLTHLFLSLLPEAQGLIEGYKKQTVLDRIEDYPTAFWFIFRVSLIIIIIILALVFAIPLIPFIWIAERRIRGFPMQSGGHTPPRTPAAAHSPLKVHHAEKEA